MAMTMMMTFGLFLRLFQCGRDDGSVQYQAGSGRRTDCSALVVIAHKLVATSYTIIYNSQQQERHDTMSQVELLLLAPTAWVGFSIDQPHLINRRTALYRATPRHATPVEN